MIGQRERWAIAVGAVAVGALLVTAEGGPALYRWHVGVRESAEELSAEAQRMEAGLRGSRSRRLALAAARARLASSDSMLLSASSPASAATSLIERIVAAAEVAETNLGSVQPWVDSARTGPLTHVRAKVQVTGELATIVDFMASLEEGPALLAIRELSLARGEASAAGGARTLRAELLVEGMVRVDGSPASPAGR